MSSNSDDSGWFKWVIGAIIALLAAVGGGPGIKALRDLFHPQPPVSAQPPPPLPSYPPPPPPPPGPPPVPEKGGYPLDPSQRLR